jgi:hypothetical protein
MSRNLGGEPGPGIAEAGIEKTVTNAIVAIRSLFMMTLSVE